MLPTHIGLWELKPRSCIAITTQQQLHLLSVEFTYNFVIGTGTWNRWLDISESFQTAYDSRNDGFAG